MSQDDPESEALLQRVWKAIKALVLMENKHIRMAKPEETIKSLTVFQGSRVGQEAIRTLESLQAMRQSTRLQAFLNKAQKALFAALSLEATEVMDYPDLFLNLLDRRVPFLFTSRIMPTVNYSPDDVIDKWIIPLKVRPKTLFRTLGEILRCWDRSDDNAVYMTERKVDNLPVIIKVMSFFSYSSPLRHLIMTEILLLKSYTDLNRTRRLCVEYIESFLYEDQVWVIAEGTDAGNLQDFVTLAVMDEREIAYVCKQILLFLTELHSQNRITRDLNTTNILLNRNGEILFGDLGLSSLLLRSPTIYTRRIFMAPELLLPEMYPHGQEIDIWSLGCICYEKADGRPPYWDCDSFESWFKTATLGAPPLQVYKASEDFNHFLSLCLNEDPKLRAPAHALLNHPFLEKTCTQEEFSEIVKFRKLLVPSGWN
jgi:serine/threonine protein kinase